MPSQNGWPLIPPGDNSAPRLRRFRIPMGGTKFLEIPLRDGSAGFLLADYALWHHEVIEPLTNNPPDDWGYNYRPIGDTDTWSNHASGTAEDLNSTKHPFGKRHTYPLAKRIRIRTRLRLRYRGAIRSGIWYRTTPDDMHFEIDKSLSECEKLARKLMYTKRGSRIIAANPGLRQVILS